MGLKRLLFGAAATAACWIALWHCGAMAQDEPSAEVAAEKSPAALLSGGDSAAASRSLLEDLNVQSLWLDNTLTAWLVLLASIVVGLAVGKIVAAVLRRLGAGLEARGRQIRAHLCSDLAGPAALALLAFALTIGLVDLKMSGAMRLFYHKVLLLLHTIAAFWYVYNLIAVVDVAIHRISRRPESALDRQVVPLVRKTLRIFLVVVGLLFVVDTVFGQDIGAWLAGLGIAGVAVSLAAQDSLKNLFGSLTILLDQPFRLGERIVFANFDGVVEEIGFRSTKIRTAAGTVVNIPNASIVNSPVENCGRRPFIRRSFNLNVAYDTPPAKIEQAVQILRDILAEEGIREPIHPVIQGEDYRPRVYFSEFNADSLAFSVTYWYAPPNYWDYMEHAQKLNLRIAGEFAKAGILLALPVQNIRPMGSK